MPPSCPALQALAVSFIFDGTRTPDTKREADKTVSFTPDSGRCFRSPGKLAAAEPGPKRTDPARRATPQRPFSNRDQIVNYSPVRLTKRPTCDKTCETQHRKKGFVEYEQNHDAVF